MKRLLTALVLGALGLVCPLTPARADTTGSIAGHIEDAHTGVPIGGVAVVVQSPEELRKTVTDAKGNYVVLCLPPSTYCLALSKDGYRTAILNEILVLAGRRSIANLQIHRHIIEGIVHHDPWSPVAPNVTSDLYVVTTWNDPFFRMEAARAQILQIVPGVQSTDAMPVKL